MAESGKCLGHGERETRVESQEKNKWKSYWLLLWIPQMICGGCWSWRVQCARKPDWKVIEEFRMVHLPPPDRSDKIDFGKRKKGAGKINNWKLSMSQRIHIHCILHVCHFFCFWLCFLFYNACCCMHQSCTFVFKTLITHVALRQHFVVVQMHVLEMIFMALNILHKLAKFVFCCQMKVAAGV